MNQQTMHQTNLQTILDELHREMELKQDYMLSPKRDLMMDPNNGRIVTSGFNTGYDTTDWSLSQLAGRLNIDTRYLRRCPPKLQAENVNYWLYQKPEDTNWLVRTHENRATGSAIVRGFLSDKYSAFDDHEFVDILHGIFNSGADYRIQGWHRDFAGFHMRLILPDLTANIGKTLDGRPDTHMVGLHIENSEVGKKSIRIRPLVYRLICTNGMMGWSTDGEIFQQRHVYLNHNEMYSRVAKAIGDGLKAGDDIMNTLIEAKQTPLKEEPLAILEQLAKSKKYSQDASDNLREAFMMEPGNSPFYISQAFTRAAQSYDPDRRVEMERDGGRVLEQLLK